MPSFKWDDASDRLMLLAYLETNNSLPRDYEPLALVLGPQVSTKMVQCVSSYPRHTCALP